MPFRRSCFVLALKTSRALPPFAVFLKKNAEALRKAQSGYGPAFLATARKEYSKLSDAQKALLRRQGQSEEFASAAKVRTEKVLKKAKRQGGKPNPFALFYKAKYASLKGTTPSEKLKEAAVLWRAKHGSKK